MHNAQCNGKSLRCFKKICLCLYLGLFCSLDSSSNTNICDILFDKNIQVDYIVIYFNIQKVTCWRVPLVVRQ